MLNKHVKSPCCGVKAVRFGGKRRQCPLCKSTWRIRPARRGRKPRRFKANYLAKVFNRGFRVKNIPTTQPIIPDAVRKRFDKALDQFVARPRHLLLPEGPLILLADAQWHKFNHKMWTLYFLAIKPAGKDKAALLDPILRSGTENAAAWEQIIEELPKEAKNRIVAFVSDGLRGLKRIPHRYGWVHQRCNFHLIAELAKRRGKRQATPGREGRERIFQTVLELLQTEATTRIPLLKQDLCRLIAEHDCPSRLRMIAKDFLRNFTLFRAWLAYPEMGLPNTVGIMESLNSRVRRKSVTVRTPESWHKWAVAAVRHKPIFVCQRAKKSTKFFPSSLN